LKDGDEFTTAATAIGALGDPTRRALYRFVADHNSPVGREDAATALGIHHHVARFHLDRLVKAGLLEVDYKRPEGRGGPGAGHPTKLYRRAVSEFSVTVPERRYDVAGIVLASAVSEALNKDASIEETLAEAARETGRAIGRGSERRRNGRGRRKRTPLGAALEALESFGFAPRPEGRVDDEPEADPSNRKGGSTVQPIAQSVRRSNGRTYVLGNCPFRTLAKQIPDVVCGMNLSLVGALLEEVGVDEAAVHLEPSDDRCCVTIRS